MLHALTLMGWLINAACSDTDGLINAACSDTDGLINAACSDTDGLINAACSDTDGLISAACSDTDGLINAACSDTDGLIDAAFMLSFTVPVLCELPHDKTNKMTCTQRRLRLALASAQSDIRVLPCTQWVAKDLSFLHADSEDCHQTGWMPRLI